MNSSFITTHQAECMDCYRCLRNCPVKSIGFSSTDKAYW